MTDTKDTRLRNLIKSGDQCPELVMAEEPPKKFRVTAKEFFFTWSQCPAPRQVAMDLMLSKGDVAWAKVAQEHHQDGNLHLHGVVNYLVKKNFKDCRAFDFEFEGKVYHPNFQAARNMRAVTNYHFKEDDDKLEFGTESFVDTIIGLKRKDAIDYCVKNKVSKQWYDEAMRCKPDLYTINGPQDIHVKARIRHSQLLALEEHEPLKAIVICGMHSLGKTTCAKRLGPYPMLWVRHNDGLKRFIAGFHKSILFDDMKFVHMPREAQLHLVDERDLNELHLRYSTATVPAGVKRIFTCNFEGWPLMEDDEAIKARVTQIKVYGEPDLSDHEIEEEDTAWRTRCAR